MPFTDFRSYSLEEYLSDMRKCGYLVEFEVEDPNAENGRALVSNEDFFKKMYEVFKNTHNDRLKDVFYEMDNDLVWEKEKRERRFNAAMGAW